MRKWWFEKQAGVRPGAKYHFHFGKVLHGYLERYQLRQPLEPVGWDKGLHVGTYPGLYDGQAVDHRQWIRDRANESIRQGLVRAVTRDVHIEYQLSALIGDAWVDSRGMPLLGVAKAQIGADGERRAIAPTQFYDPGGLLHTDINIPKEAFELGYFTGFMDGLDLTPEHPGIFDHKTAKNRTYAKSPAKLLVDEQMLSYAAVLLAMPGFERQEKVYLRHNVFLKDPEVPLEKGVYGVDASVEVAAVAEHWRWVIDTAKSMVQWRQVPVGIGVARANAYEQVPSALQVMGYEKGKKEACECYGGCPYKNACLGYKKIESVVAELDYEVRRVDVYGNDPIKKAPVTYVEKTFTLNKKRSVNPAVERALARVDAIMKEIPCLVDTRTYPKSPTEPVTPKDQSMPFLKPAAQQPAYVPPLTVGSYAWVDDPDTINKSYRCNIRAIRGEGDAKEVDLYLYEDCTAPKPMTAEMAADVDRAATGVPWSAVSASLKTGRGGFSYYVAPQPAAPAVAPAGEAIPGTPIPTAGPVSINTPNADAVLAASTTKVEPAAPAAAAATETPAKRPAGRPRRTAPAAQPAAEVVAEQLPEGARQTTISELGDAAPVIDRLRDIERVALEAVLKHVTERLAELNGA